MHNLIYFLIPRKLYLKNPADHVNLFGLPLLE